MDEQPNRQRTSVPGRIVGVDYGTKRIGLAITDPEQTFASPLSVYERQTPEVDAKYFRRLVEEERVALFVVGLPVFGSGDESRLSHESREFGKWLNKTTGVEVAYYDERYTSLEADQLMNPTKLTRKRRKTRRDMLAAQILLSAFLDSSRRGDSSPGALED